MILAIALMAATTVTACNGGGETAGEPTAMDDTASTDGGAAATDLSVKTMDTFAFDPPTVSAAAGSTVNLTLDNTGQALEHTWVLLPMTATMEDALALADPPPADAILYELRVPAGETASGTFTAPSEAGAYIVVCAVAGHAAGGMTGTLTVQ
jgi:plastocyanin